MSYVLILEGIVRSVEDNMFVISKHVLISIGFTWGNDYYKEYFSTDYIKHFVTELLDIKVNIISLV